MPSLFHHTDEFFWVYPFRRDDWKAEIIGEFRVHPVMAQILVSRGFTSLEEIHSYLYAKLPDLHNPFLMDGMKEAVDRICCAIHKGEAILIYGDNDVDGMTGTALLTEFLQYIGAKVFFYVSTPGASRRNLIVEALEYALRNCCSLLVTVDCGITASAEIAEVEANCVDVIITDHHEPVDALPHCVAVLNPKLKANSYPNRELTGVGVVFKFAHAITERLVADGSLLPNKVDLKRYLDLVALGTISDMGVLLGENRLLVRYGLRQLRRTKRIGLAKLISIADVDCSHEFSVLDVATRIAPRLNSLGRIDDPRKGVELLLIRNVQVAGEMALDLDLKNLQRQRIERSMTSDVEARITLEPELLQHKAIVIAGEAWHPGIVAILSMRISKHYNRPTAIIAVENGLGKGSLRSTIPEFPILPVLKEFSDLFVNFGGHDFAAGLTIETKRIPEFTQRFYDAADRRLVHYDIKSKLYLDAEIHLHELTSDFMESIALLAPYGNENPPPLLYSHVQQAWPPKVVGKNHLKLHLEEEAEPGLIIEGICFGRAFALETLKRRPLLLDVAFTPQVRHYTSPSIQLSIRDFKLHHQERS